MSLSQRSVVRMNVSLLSCALTASAIMALGGCTRGRINGRPTGDSTTPTDQTRLAKPAFTDVTQNAGLAFRQYHGGCGQRYFVEQVAAGAAMIDANCDGNVDIYFPQPQPLGICKGKLPGPLHHRLYLNDGAGRFRLAKNAFHGVDTDYGLAAVVGDYDNDGKEDLYVCCYGKNKLFHNNGDGTFTDVTKRAGLEVGGFSTGGVWFDYDGDGYLDLYVLRYCEWTVATDIQCSGPHNEPDVCNPQTYTPATNKLFHNNGDGTFTDVTARSGAAPEKRRSLGVAAFDFDGDGKLDLFVANDLGPNYLLHNLGGGKFEDVATQTGCALGPNANNQANMGVAVGDFNDSGRLSVLVTTFANEPNTLYRCDGAFFTDISLPSYVGEVTKPFLTFGTGFVDTRNSGLLDLFFANGHISPFAYMKDPKDTYKQRCQLLLNEGHETFREAKDALPPSDVRVHRGVCFGDVNGDGKIDILNTASDDRPTLLRNDTTNAGNWLLVKLITAKGCATAIGARCTVVLGTHRIYRPLIGGGSFGGDSDHRVHFGLGSATKIDRLEIKWLSGRTQVLNDLPANRVMTIREPK